MAAIVIKSHELPTADRAMLARELVPGVAVFGGLALNAASCGGLNVDAVRNTIALGGKIIWLPTVSAANHQAYVARKTALDHVRNLSTSNAIVHVCDSSGRVLSKLDRILDLIAEADVVLATGHLSPQEAAAVCSRARELGVRRILVTHPEMSFIAMDLPTQRDLAAPGVMFERCYVTLLMDRVPARTIVDSIRAIGAASTILATDLGQAANPPATEGLRDYWLALSRAGLTVEEWRQMAVENPAAFLNLT